MKLRGIIPPVVTPMTADQELDLPGLRAHIDRMLAAGVDAVFVLGTTGEFYALDEAEKHRVAAEALAHVAGRSLVSVITPYFIKPNQNELFDHFRRVAAAAGSPARAKPKGRVIERSGSVAGVCGSLRAEREPGRDLGF